MTRLLSISSTTSWASLVFFIHPHTHSSSRLIWLPPKHHGLSKHTPMFLLQTHLFFISYFLVWIFTFYSFFTTPLRHHFLKDALSDISPPPLPKQWIHCSLSSPYSYIWKVLHTFLLKEWLKNLSEIIFVSLRHLVFKKKFKEVDKCKNSNCNDKVFSKGFKFLFNSCACTLSCHYNFFSWVKINLSCVLENFSWYFMNF